MGMMLSFAADVGGQRAIPSSTAESAALWPASLGVRRKNYAPGARFTDYQDFSGSICESGAGMYKESASGG
jgi:hypothetical protein